jgi:hypothetical protein
LFTISTNDANRDTIHVALAIYDPKRIYSRHSGVVMFSLFERTKSRVCVHILHDRTLTERNRALLSETAEIFAQQVEFYDVSSYIDQIGIDQIGSDAVQLARKWSVGSLFRLLIPDVLPFTHQKTSQCYKKIGRRLRKDFFGRGYFVFLWLLLKIFYSSLSNYVRG